MKAPTQADVHEPNAVLHAAKAGLTVIAATK